MIGDGEQPPGDFAAGHKYSVPDTLAGTLLRHPRPVPVPTSASTRSAAALEAATSSSKATALSVGLKHDRTSGSTPYRRQKIR